MSINLTGTGLTVDKVVQVARGKASVTLDPEARRRIEKCRALLEDKLQKKEIMYGVNTGIGELANVVLTQEQIEQYQRYLIYSHAAGYGKPMPEEIVRAAILSRISVHCHGHSGLRPVVTETLIELLNKGVTPVMCEKGSVGACGDLSPMAQMALVPMGEGRPSTRASACPAPRPLSGPASSPSSSTPATGWP